MQEDGILIMKKKKHPKGEKQIGRELCTLNIHTRRKTTDQHRTTDTRSLNRETNEGKEGDTGRATEILFRKQDGRGQTIDSRVHGTNNKPCAQHT